MKIFSMKRATVAAGAVMVAAAATALSTVPASAQANKNDPVVATVNGDKIYLSDLITIHRSLPARIRRLPIQRIYRPLLEHAISTHLLAKAGDKAGLRKDKQLQAAVEQYTRRVLAQLYLRKAAESKVTEEALKAAYEDFKKNFKGEPQVRARHILLKTKEEAQKVIAALDGGADFAKLAREKSTGPSKAQGGDLGYFRRNQMVKPFADAAFKMKKGEYTKVPVKTQFGWHVILVVDKRKPTPPEYEKVKDQLRDQVSRKMQSEVAKQVRAEAKITRFNIDGSPAAPANKPDDKKEDKKDK